MKRISDIRLYKSERQNEYGAHFLCSFADKRLNAMTSRMVMKLREQGFSLGEFDHLYFVFTVCDMTEKIHISEEVDRYHPWYRMCFVKINDDLYAHLGDAENHDYIIGVISHVLADCFASEDFDSARIHSCIQEALKHGEKMLMKFKEKIIAKRRAVIFLRYSDQCSYCPLLSVYDTDGMLLFERELPETSTLDCFGEIQLSTKKVTIKPRRNAFTIGAEAMIFKY